MFLSRRSPSRFALSALALLLPDLAVADEAAGAPGATAEQEIARELVNPLADLVSLPLQFNREKVGSAGSAGSAGSENNERSILNFQPVVPFRLNERWNLIGRVIVPLIDSPAPGDGGRVEGLGDVLVSGFFSPESGAGTIWGFGPALSLRTAEEPVLGSEKWSAGPTAVIVRRSGPWTYGGLANHLWSFAGDEGRRDVNRSFAQPFLSWTGRGGLTVSLNSETSIDWDAPRSERFVVPVHLSVSKLLRLGPLPVSVGAGAGYYVDGPERGDDWKLRSTITFVLPRLRDGSRPSDG